MHLGDLISPDAVMPSLKVKNKKQLLTELAARLARIAGLQERDIFDVLFSASGLGPPDWAKASPFRMARWWG